MLVGGPFTAIHWSHAPIRNVGTTLSMNLVYVLVYRSHLLLGNRVKHGQVSGVLRHERQPRWRRTAPVTNGSSRPERVHGVSHMLQRVPTWHEPRDQRSPYAAAQTARHWSSPLSRIVGAAKIFLGNQCKVDRSDKWCQAASKPYLCAHCAKLWTNTTKPCKW